MNAAFHVKCYVCITWLIRRLFFVHLSLFLNALNKHMYVCHVFMYVRLNDGKRVDIFHKKEDRSSIP